MVLKTNCSMLNCLLESMDRAYHASHGWHIANIRQPQQPVCIVWPTASNRQKQNSRSWVRYQSPSLMCFCYVLLYLDFHKSFGLSLLPICMVFVAWFPPKKNLPSIYIDTKKMNFLHKKIIFLTGIFSHKLLQIRCLIWLLTQLSKVSRNYAWHSKCRDTRLSLLQYQP